MTKLENTYIKINQKRYMNMKFMSKPGIIIKIQLLQGSEARNYFESKERLFLGTILSKLQNTDNDLNISDEEKNDLENIFKKYEKFL
jgi:hypothetical protein